MNAETHWLSRVSPGPGLGYSDFVKLGGLDPYGQHQTLCRLFDQPVGKPRDLAGFLFRVETRDGLPLFYVLSRTPPRDDTGKWRIEPKEYQPDLRAGDRLAFTLRANPVSMGKAERDEAEREAWRKSRAERRLKEKDPTRKRQRHDVVMDTKRRMGWKDLPESERPSLAVLAHEAGSCWLRERQDSLGCRFDADRLRVDGYRVHRMLNRRCIVVSTLDFSGVLEVTDPERFSKDALLKGIGPAKAFGCGLMLVRRA